MTQQARASQARGNECAREGSDEDDETQHDDTTRDKPECHFQRTMQECHPAILPESGCPRLHPGCCACGAGPTAGRHARGESDRLSPNWECTESTNTQQPGKPRQPCYCSRHSFGLEQFQRTQGVLCPSLGGG
jgi:hypothetical protein